MELQLEAKPHRSARDKDIPIYWLKEIMDVVFYPEAPGADLNVHIDMMKAKPDGSYLFEGGKFLRGKTWKRIADAFADNRDIHIKFDPVQKLPTDPEELKLASDAVRIFFDSDAEIGFTIGTWEVTKRGLVRTLTFVGEAKEEGEEDPVLTFLIPFATRFQHVKIDKVIPEHKFFMEHVNDATMIMSGDGLMNEWLISFDRPTCPVEGHVHKPEEFQPCMSMVELTIDSIRTRSMDVIDEVFLNLACCYPSLRKVNFSISDKQIIEKYMKEDPDSNIPLEVDFVLPPLETVD